MIDLLLLDKNKRYSQKTLTVLRRLAIACLEKAVELESDPKILALLHTGIIDEYLPVKKLLLNLGIIYQSEVELVADVIVELKESEKEQLSELLTASARCDFSGSEE